MKRVLVIILSATTTLALGGCEGGTVKQIVGMDRSSPDEFRVATRPPLSVPPEFTLRPPGDTQGTAAATAPAHEKAQSLILGDDNTFALPSGESDNTEHAASAASKTPVHDSADAQFLKNAGADVADSSVRTQLEEEKITKQLEQEEEGWWDSIANWEKKEPIVDAKKESERIQKNQEEGKPVNEGEVAETKQKDTGVLGRIFGDW